MSVHEYARRLKEESALVRVSARPIGFVLEQTANGGLVHDGQSPAVLAFSARHRAREYAGLLERYYAAIDARDMNHACELETELRELRLRHGRGWLKAEPVRRPLVA